jgi:hypothetical protein
MDDSEIYQRVIGILTQCYFAVRDRRDLADPEITAGLSTLANGDFMTYKLDRHFDVPPTQDGIEAVVTACLTDIVRQVRKQTTTVFGAMAALFCELALEAEQTSQVDVPEFLHQAGLHAASGE